jgi:hypothetical protein
MLAEALMIIGTAAQGIGEISAGQASAKSLKLKAKYARMEGREAKRLSDYRVRLIHEAGAELGGQIEAETGKSGLAMTGTPLASLVDSARKVELSAALEKRAGTITQQRYEQAASAYEQDAKAMKQSGFLGALGALTGLKDLGKKDD